MKIARICAAAGLTLVLAACETTGPEPKDYTAFRGAAPRSVVIVPVINHSTEAEAANLFLTTMTIPLAERGYYVFPVNMVRGLMENDGLADPMLVHSTETVRVGSLFGADSILYVEILDWDVSYAVFASGVTVEFVYTLKDARSGELLWQDHRRFYHDKSAGSGNIFVDLVANAVQAAADSTTADYTTSAMAANAQALLFPGQGIPFGPYNPNFGNDSEAYPSTGSGKLSNATVGAVATGGEPPPVNE